MLKFSFRIKAYQCKLNKKILAKSKKSKFYDKVRQNLSLGNIASQKEDIVPPYNPNSKYCEIVIRDNIASRATNTIYIEKL